MSRKRSLIRAGAVLAVALSAGHIMQSGMDPDRNADAKPPAERPTRVVQVSAGEDALTPVPGPAPAARMVAPALAAKAEPALDCTPRMDLRAAPQQMIELRLQAACQPGQRVVLRHGGLAIAETLDGQGRLALALPALEAGGAVSALFEDAAIATGQVRIAGMDQVQRFAVQWMAADTFSLHAEAGGAAAVSPQAPVAGQGGSVVALGDPGLDLPMMAEVFTWPAASAPRLHPVIEAEVTDLTCGREMLGETLLAADGRVTVSELTLAMPGCEALGDILVLNNLVPDLTLATAN